MTEKKKSIAVHIQSEVQFFSLKPLLDELKKAVYDFVIVVDDFCSDKTGYKDMADHVVKLIQKSGFSPVPISSQKKKLFDVYLTPYLDGIIKSKAYIKFEYGTLNIKPSLTYTHEAMAGYHGFLCQSIITYNMLSAYGKTFPVDNLRFFGKNTTRKKRTKKQLLFAPTYNDDDNVEELEKIIQSLKREYYVVIKGHHGTEYLKNNKDKKQTFESLADEYYDSETSLSDLILASDVCLFGNSSAIAEALYAGVPCAVYAHDLDLFKLDNIHTTQFLLVRDGFLPYCNSPAEISAVISKALSPENEEKQARLAESLFPKTFRTGINGYLEAIEFFLDNPESEDYIKLHDYNLSTRSEALAAKDAEIKHLRQEIIKRDGLLLDYSKRKLYRFSDKLYNIEGKIIRVFKS